MWHIRAMGRYRIQQLLAAVSDTLSIDYPSLTTTRHCNQPDSSKRVQKADWTGSAHNSQNAGRHSIKSTNRIMSIRRRKSSEHLHKHQTSRIKKCLLLQALKQMAVAISWNWFYQKFAAGCNATICSFVVWRLPDRWNVDHISHNWTRQH